MPVPASEVILVLPEFNPPDTLQSVGGSKSNFLVESDVTSVFMPGAILPSDFSDISYAQYRKIFVKNNSLTRQMLNTRIFGYNVKNNSMVKFALEKKLGGLPLVDGSETISNYLTAPGIFSDYVFTEIHSDDALLVGNSGRLLPQQGQGLFLKMMLTASDSQDPSDNFRVGVKWD